MEKNNENNAAIPLWHEATGEIGLQALPGRAGAGEQPEFRYLH